MALEKIIQSVKNAGKSIKRNAKAYTMIGAAALGGYLADKSVPESYADGLKITNSSSTLGDKEAYAQHLLGTNEGFDSYDIVGGNDMADIDVYIHNDDNRDLRADVRPSNSITPFDIKLKVNKSIANADNSLNFNVMVDDGAFNHRKIIAYDAANPNVKYEIPNLDGTELKIPLPDLVNKQPGVYANWKVEMPRIIEGDINEDGVCDYQDIMTLANEWLQTSDPAQNNGNYLTSDVNKDRVTDFKDFAIIAKDYGKSEE